jgi:transcriptional regulator with XRE-family HTH domain
MSLTTRVTEMTDGTKYLKLAEDVLLDDYYACLHDAYDSMRDAFEARAHDEGLTQEDIATQLDVDAGLISRRLSGTENISLRTLSNMGSAMRCRVTVKFWPYEEVGSRNFYKETPSAPLPTPANESIQIGRPVSAGSINVR